MNALHRDAIFRGHGPVRTLYLSILASHVIPSIVALSMMLTTLFFSLRAGSRCTAEWQLTHPIWLYVSITVVVVFVLKAHALQDCRTNEIATLVR